MGLPVWRAGRGAAGDGTAHCEPVCGGALRAAQSAGLTIVRADRGAVDKHVEVCITLMVRPCNPRPSVVECRHVSHGLRESVSRETWMPRECDDRRGAQAHSERDTLEAQAGAIVKEALSAAGAVAPEEAISRCADIAVWLGPKATRLGLTQFACGDDVALELMAPGFPLIPLFASEEVRLAEAGAGSGALGLALAVLCPTLGVTLIDRRHRAAGFIELAIRRFDVANAMAACCDLRGHGTTYDWVVARALAPGSSLLSELWVLCEPDGRIALIESGDVRRAPAGLRRSFVLPTAVEGLRVNVYERDNPAS